MKKLLILVSVRVFLPVLLIAIGAIGAGFYIVDYVKLGNDNINWFNPDTGIDQSEMVNIGGVDQYVSVRSQDLSNPVLLDVHGGPGGAQSSYTYRFLRPWTEYFTLVEWDQRGAGRSNADPEALKSTMTYDRMVSDTIEVIEYLQRKFGVEKVILVGHSWGTVLGLSVAKRRPDLLHAYVGLGQVVAWRPNFEETARLMIAEAERVGDSESAETLRALPKEWPPREDVDAFFQRVVVIQGIMQKYGKGLHTIKNYDSMMDVLRLEIMGSPDLTLKESLAEMKLSDATKELWADIYDLDLRRELGTEFDAPLFFFQGDHDWQTPTTLAKSYIETIHSPIKQYVPFKNSAHWMMNEEPGKLLVELVTRVRPLAMSTNDAVVKTEN